MADALHMEVKKHAVRQTQDGWVVSFVVHPNDIDPIFAVAPLGTRYMLAIAQIGDDEQPIAPGPTQAVAPDNGAYPKWAGRVVITDVGTCTVQMSTPSAQPSPAPLPAAPLRVNGGQWNPIPTWRPALGDDTGKGGNPALDPDMEAARIRAVMLCKDERFQRWLGTNLYATDVARESASKHRVRGLCDINSRAEIATNHDAYMRFLALEGRYRVATGLMAEQRG